MIVERFDESTATNLVTLLQEAGYWGPAMPLEQLYETLVDDLPIRIAEADRHVPNVEIKFASNQYDRAALAESLTVQLSNETFRIGSLELQIAYKLHMGAQRDFEDALYLHEMVGPNLNRQVLESYVRKLDVEDEYAKLRRT